MTALLWQTALMLLAAYFLGAWVACMIRRTFFADVTIGPPDEILHSSSNMALSPAAASGPASAPLLRPDPASVGPTIAPIPRPEPAPATDASVRLERALTLRGPGSGAGPAAPARAPAPGAVRPP